MGKINKSIRFIGEVIALTTEKSIKGSSKIIIKTLGENVVIKEKMDETYKFGDDLSDRIIEKTKKIANLCDDIANEAFTSKTNVYGDTRYIYEEDKIINSNFEVEE
ncbi:hypothetical protein SAMN02745163_04226 [Clostridium cavendishii DSM 21758]|uniref:Uncharacterized protein n=1 Tax=Clostridium cavendishii DSM 21758 TaxID=1121302 RepID=A0A1M6U9Y9_9CLOT|nr:hypothetical protein [Clostridium cavendishii]SHK65981.1 hypothetical protein SAMN02745163_04226 [Clostridium cavendishii DSM 21758]